MLEALNAQWIRFIGSDYLVTGPALAMGLFVLAFALVALFLQHLNLRRENRIFQMELGINTRIDETNYELNERLHRLDEQIRNMDKEIDPSLTLFEQCREAMVMICENRILDMNHAAMALFGFQSKEEALAKQPEDLVSEENNGPSADAFHEGMKTSEHRGHGRFGWTYCRADHSPVEAETVISLIQRCGRQVLLFSIRPRNDDQPDGCEREAQASG